MIARHTDPTKLRILALTLFSDSETIFRMNLL
jgi:hypothetical protein